VSRLLAVVFALLLGACSTVPQTPARSPAELEILWQQHRQAVARFADWSLAGRIAVTTEDDGWSGELHWSQTADSFQIKFIGPFGQGAFLMKGNLQGVELHLSDGQVFNAPDAESLLLTHVGWSLPLSDFRFWVAGMTEPQSEIDKSLNNSGQLAELRQEQWRISYPEYFAVGDVMMPRKVYFRNHDLSVRLVIDSWSLITT